ncbi:MAG: MFS transporter [Proteobacteria bacterium]|nr:MFS transporter [Pseudomonadota bacterium]
MANFGFTEALKLKGQTAIALVGLGHGAVHWVYMVFTVLTPWIKQSFGLSYTEIGSLHAIFHIASFAANAGSGVLVDITGKRVLFQVVAVMAGGVAILVCGYAGGFALLAAMMALIGASNNLWHPAALAFLSQEYPENKGYALSVHSVGASLGDILAPLVAVTLCVGILELNWQTTAIGSSVPVFLVGFALLVIVLPKDSNSPSGEGKRGMSGREYLSGLGALFKDRAILGLSLMAAFRTSALFCIFFALPFYLVDELGLSEETQGLAMAMMQVGGFVPGPLAGTWSDRIGRRPIVMGGLSVITITIIGLTFVGNPAVFVVGITVLGFALYAIRPVTQAWMMDLAPKEHGASAASVMFAMQSGWTPVVVFLSGVIADEFGLLYVFYLIAASMLCANIVAYFLPGEKAASN